MKLIVIMVLAGLVYIASLPPSCNSKSKKPKNNTYSDSSRISSDSIGGSERDTLRAVQPKWVNFIEAIL